MQNSLLSQYHREEVAKIYSWSNIKRTSNVYNGMNIYEVVAFCIPSDLAKDIKPILKTQAVNMNF
ncbi:MAG TPA: hypothetical protein VNS32_16430, partial [Flavisolibacter sp.]|nr:hypothetical protein [Flavisolibacter sp.]